MELVLEKLPIPRLPKMPLVGIEPSPAPVGQGNGAVRTSYTGMCYSG